MHSRSVCVKNPRHFDFDPILAVVVEEERLRAALSFIVASPLPNWIDVAPIVFVLRMHAGIAVYLGRRGLEDPTVKTSSHPENVNCAVYVCSNRMQRIMLVMYRSGRASEIVDLINLNVERKSNVLAYKFKVILTVQMSNVAFRARKIIVDTHDLMAGFEELVAQMRTKKAGAASYKNGLALSVSCSSHW